MCPTLEKLKFAFFRFDLVPVHREFPGITVVNEGLECCIYLGFVADTVNRSVITAPCQKGKNGLPSTIRMFLSFAIKKPFPENI